MMGEKFPAVATSTSSNLIKLHLYSEPGRVWGAYGVATEDGAISYKTYSDPESAKEDPLFRGRARIVRLTLKDAGTEFQRELSFHEKLREKHNPPKP
jgi:hypothetical protein